MSAVRLPATQRRAGGQVSTLHCCSISAELKFCNMNLAARSPPRSSNALKYGFVTLVVKRPISSAADAATAAAALLEAVAVGDLTPSEASEVDKLIEAYVKAKMTKDEMIGWFKSAPMGSRHQRMLWAAHKIAGLTGATEGGTYQMLLVTLIEAEKQLDPWEFNDCA
jgi:hypothetical protein